MGEIAEELFAERVVTHVLDGGTAVGIGVRLPQLRGGCAREARE
jgi:hypothetical protein